MLSGTTLLACASSIVGALSEDAMPLLVNVAFTAPCMLDNLSAILQCTVAVGTGSLEVSSAAQGEGVVQHISAECRSTGSAGADSVLPEPGRIWKSLFAFERLKLGRDLLPSIAAVEQKAATELAPIVSPAASDAVLHLSALAASDTQIALGHSPLTFVPTGTQAFGTPWKRMAENIGWGSSAVEFDGKHESKTHAVLTGQAIMAGLTARSMRSQASKKKAVQNLMYETVWEGAVPISSNAGPDITETAVCLRSRGSGGESLQIKPSAGTGAAVALLQALQTYPAVLQQSWLPKGGNLPVPTCLAASNAGTDGAQLHAVMKVATAEQVLVTPAVLLTDSVAALESTSVQRVEHFGSYAASSVLFSPVLVSNGSHSKMDSSTKSNAVPQCAVVSGAFGGLGVIVSQWLLQQGAGNVVMLGRSGKSDGASALVPAAQNCILHGTQADAAASEDMAAALLPCRDFDTVVHVGGVIRDGSIPGQTLRSFVEASAPKLHGWALMAEALSSAGPLQRGIAFSSIAGALGSVGQANYAAANAGLDAMCARGCQVGLSMASIQWGVWSEAGMAASQPALIRRLEAKGYEAMEPRTGLSVLHAVVTVSGLSSGITMASSFIWDKFIANQHSRPAFFRAVAPQLVSDGVQKQPHVLEYGQVQLATSKDDVLREIKSAVHSILGTSGSLDLDAPLMEAGMDSVGVVELRNHLASALGLSLPATLVFEHPSAKAMAEYIAGLLATAMPAAPTARDMSQQGWMPISAPDSGLPAARSLASLEQEVLSIVREVAGVDLAAEDPLMDSGVDSIGMMELRNALATRFALTLPATVAYDHPSPAALARFFAEHISNNMPAATHLSGRQFEAYAPGTTAGQGHAGVVGMACRFPSLESRHDGALCTFAAQLLHSSDLPIVVPLERWNIDGAYHPTVGQSGTTYCRIATLLPEGDLAQFDPEIFKLTSTEAALMDPHGRMLLELTAEATMEAQAGGTGLHGSSANVGTYVGCMWATEYIDLLPSMGISTAQSAAIAGNTFPFMVGRVAYCFGWQGPCVPTDTACSSSLVAAHTALGALTTGECSFAAVGGVNALLAAQTTIKISALQALSPVGRCKTFDSSADGYGRGEGFTVMMLEPVIDGISQKYFLAVLHGTAVNSAGRSSGLTAPSGPAQRALVTIALKASRATASELASVAVHGTGTSLGDPIEMSALRQALGGAATGVTSPIAFTSVKSCYGHTEGAAGLAGALLAMVSAREAFMPGIIGLRELNPYVAQAVEGSNGFKAVLPRQVAAASDLLSSRLAGKALANINLHFIFLR